MSISSSEAELTRNQDDTVLKPCKLLVFNCKLRHFSWKSESLK